MMEMYCGCGAHTSALGVAMGGKIGRIKAVEMDERLVESCRVNVGLNGLGGRVEVVKGDAGWVSRRILKRRERGEEEER